MADFRKGVSTPAQPTLKSWSRNGGETTKFMLDKEFKLFVNLLEILTSLGFTKKKIKEDSPDEGGDSVAITSLPAPCLSRRRYAPCLNRVKAKD